MILLQYRVSAWGCVTGYSFCGSGFCIGDSFGGCGSGLSYCRYTKDERAPCLFCLELLYLALWHCFIALFHFALNRLGT